MNSNISWRLRVRSRVYKILARFPNKDQQRIAFAIENLLTNPFTGDCEKMRGDDYVWRRRAGNYRIFYEIRAQEKVVYVFRMERRASKTY